MKEKIKVTIDGLSITQGNLGKYIDSVLYGLRGGAYHENRDISLVFVNLHIECGIGGTDEWVDIVCVADKPEECCD